VIPVVVVKACGGLRNGACNNHGGKVTHSVRTTFNFYGHLFPDREEELVAGLDRREFNAKADQERTKRNRRGNRPRGLKGL
jgi:hypothetical protein